MERVGSVKPGIPTRRDMPEFPFLTLAAEKGWVGGLMRWRAAETRRTARGRNERHDICKSFVSYTERKVQEEAGIPVFHPSEPLEDGSAILDRIWRRKVGRKAGEGHR